MRRYVAPLAGLLVVVAGAVPAAAAVTLPATSSPALIWLDPSSIVATGGSVTAWNDLAGAGGSQNFVQATASYRPAVTAAMLPGGSTYNVVDFDGTSDFLELGATTAMAGNDWTWFLVMQGANLGSNLPVPFRSADSNNDRQWGAWYNNNQWAVHARDSGGGMKATFIPDTQSGWVVLSGTWDGAAGTVGAALSRQDATDPTLITTLTSTPVTGANAVPGTHERTRLGANSRASADSFLQGQMAELIVFNSVLNANDFAAVSNYLGAKYLAYRPIPEGLVLYSPMDNQRVNRAGAHPTPGSPLSTLDGAWTVEDVWAAPSYPGTASPAGSGQSRVVSSAEGMIGQAIKFEGVTSSGNRPERFVDYGNVANHGEGGYTVSFWFNPEVTSGTQFVASKGNASSGDAGWSVWLDSTSLRVRGRHDGASNPRLQLNKGGLADDTWYHVALVIDDTVGDGEQGVLVAYLNGEGSFDYNTEALINGWSQGFDGHRFPDGASFTTTTSLRLGARSTNGAEFRGMIDDFAIWNRALTPGEIGTIYQMGLQGLTPIPEPASAVLALFGVLTLALLRRRRR